MTIHAGIVTEVKLRTRGEGKRRSEREEDGRQGGDQAPDDHGAQERTGWPQAAVRAARRLVAPHPADHSEMPQQYEGESQAQQAGRPGKGTADGVQGVEKCERAAPDSEARQQPPKPSGRNGAGAHGRFPSIATRRGSASTRPSAIAPVSAV